MVKEIVRTKDVDKQLFAGTDPSCVRELQQLSPRCGTTFDISCAFLHADVEPCDEMYVELPVARVHLALIGLSD